MLHIVVTDAPLLHVVDGSFFMRLPALQSMPMHKCDVIAPVVPGFAGGKTRQCSLSSSYLQGIARLQRLGYVGSVLTQNVDRLHQQAGAQDVLEMHGTTHE